MSVVWIWQQPVEYPNSAEVDKWEEPCGHDGKYRHRLGAAADSVSPPGSEKVEDSRDESAGVCYSDPKHEIGDIDRPADGYREPRDAHPDVILEHIRDDTRKDERSADSQSYPVIARRPAKRPNDLLVYASKYFISQGVPR